MSKSRPHPRHRTVHASLVLATLALGVGCGPPVEDGPDLILSEGRVRLGDLREPVAAVAIEGDRVVAAGSLADIRALAVDATQEMALEDAAVLPGLVDAWVDVEALGRTGSGLDLRRAVSTREVLALLRAAQPGPDGWTIGWGWDETLWPDSRLPDRTALAEIDSRPVLLYRRIGRVGWVNTSALDAAGLGAETAIEGLFRDASGEPTGILAGEALDRVEELLSPPSRETRRERLIAGLRAVVAAGITTIGTAPIDDQALAILREIERDGDLPVRVRVRLRPGAATRVASSPEPTSDSLIGIRGIGLTLDGPFRPPLAAMSEPYGNGSGNGNGNGNGTPFHDAAAIAAACQLADERGWKLDVRAHGDRAISLALENCPSIAAGSGLIVGADVPPVGLDDTDARLAAVPLRMTHDLYWLDALLGSERAARAHAWRDRLAAGRLAALASAAPEHDLDTTGWLVALSTRRDASGYPLDGWRPGQRISVADSLRVATSLLAEREAGDPFADLVVWSLDPLDPETEVASLRPLVTIVAGRVVYSRPLVDVPFDMQ